MRKILTSMKLKKFKLGQRDNIGIKVLVLYTLVLVQILALYLISLSWPGFILEDRVKNSS